MPKVDLKLALAEYEAEGKGIVSTNRYMHPLQGLQDSKGSLTRYPVIDKDTGEKMVFVDYNWLAEYLLAGGKLDAQRVYGISPYRIKKRWLGTRQTTSRAG